MKSRAIFFLVCCFIPAALFAQSQHARDREIHDADTRAWWHATEALSNDGMEGRDTGSVGYQRAAEYVVARFKAAGLQPAGDNGTYFQSVPLREASVVAEKTSFKLVRANGAETELAFLQQIGIVAADNLPMRMEAALTFRGYCGRDAMNDIAGRFVVCFGTQRQGLPTGAERAANARQGNALGVINIDDPYFSIEPPRWPVAYARSVTLRTPREPEHTTAPLAVMRLDAEATDLLFAGTGQNAAMILKLGGSKQPLPNFDIPAKLKIQLSLAQRELASNNVIAILPGADEKFRTEHLVLSAHLDGYGFGTPVNGDDLYNGTLDDAAYVALLIRLAENIKSKRLLAPKRTLLLTAFTGEEKGLLGSNWFVAHPTVPIGSIVANINLDQLRPLFPLRILTAEALADSTLGETARTVATRMQIEIRPDAEPERNLLRRADQFPFLVNHIPAISFIFGYDAGTDAEQRYREWYQTRYHRPQDDLTQPIDFEAAKKFNTFFYNLVEAVANAPKAPSIYPASQFAKKQ